MPSAAPTQTPTPKESKPFMTGMAVSRHVTTHRDKLRLPLLIVSMAIRFVWRTF